MCFMLIFIYLIYYLEFYFYALPVGYDVVEFCKLDFSIHHLGLSRLFFSHSDKNCEMNSALNPPHELDSQN